MIQIIPECVNYCDKNYYNRNPQLFACCGNSASIYWKHNWRKYKYKNPHCNYIVNRAVTVLFVPIVKIGFKYKSKLMKIVRHNKQHKNGGRYNQKIFSVICIFGLTDIQHCKKHHKRQKHHCYVIWIPKIPSVCVDVGRAVVFYGTKSHPQEHKRRRYHKADSYILLNNAICNRHTPAYNKPRKDNNINIFKIIVRRGSKMRKNSHRTSKQEYNYPDNSQKLCFVNFANHMPPVSYFKFNFSNIIFSKHQCCTPFYYIITQ